jgi:hypothetical protein
MFMLFLRDREGLLVALKLHIAWLLGFPEMVYIPLPYFPVLYLGFLVLMTAHFSRSLCHIKDRLIFGIDFAESTAFPSSKPMFRFMLKLDVFAWFTISPMVVLAIMRIREIGVPDNSLAAFFIPYLLAQGFSINLIHHFVRNRFFPSEWEARSG